jgi:cell division protein FtsL
MTVIAVFLVALGCTVFGFSLSARALAEEYRSLERKRLQLDIDRRELALQRESLDRQTEMLRQTLNLSDTDPVVVFDLGLHKRKTSVLS